MEDIQSKSIVYFTVCNNAYLNRAFVLAESLYCSNNVILKIYLFEKELPILNDIKGDFYELVLVESIDFNRLGELAFKYDVVEFTTSLKPFIALQLLNSFSKVVFLDPDVFVLGTFSHLKKMLDIEDVILTSHFNTPESDNLEFPDLGLMRFGSFNLGFFAVNNSENGKAFLNWWNSRCLDQCFFETQFGISTDQKWISIANAFFDFLFILRDPGYNVAYWNLFERKISVKDGKYLSNGSQIVFYHFSSFDTNNYKVITKRAKLSSSLISESLLELSNQYCLKLQYFSSALKSIEKKYSYDYFSNGDFISPTLRRAYASNLLRFNKVGDPFLYNSSVYLFAKKNYLLSNSDNFDLYGYSKIDENKIFFYLCNKFLKIILVILGPNKFFNLSRLFVYLSSFNRNKSLWK
jgi:hypothetical protein